MYNIQLYDYVPQPRPVTVNRIVAAHYYPAWKKGAAGLHRGFDDLHNYPERTPLCGYYDGDSPVFCDWEIKWALEHGVNCFIYCWYRKKENVGKPVTEDALRLGETLHDGFFRARYANRMQFAIMFEASPAWGAADVEDLTDHLMPFGTEQYFFRPNYLKIDNKPVLFVYDWYGKQLQENLGTPEQQKEAFDRCRALARANGFDGMIFAAEYRRENPDDISDLLARGYDFVFPYCCGLKEKDPTDERVIEFQCAKAKKNFHAFPEHYVPTASVMWDPSPRFVSMPHMYSPQKEVSLWKLNPNHWRILLAELNKLCDALPEHAFGRNMLLLDNWNEWDEGHYLLPSVEFGFEYLQAVREELTLRDNLPDYRMPQELGTPPVNTTWEAPNFSDSAIPTKPA